MDLSLDKKQLEYINLIRELGEQKITPYLSKPVHSSDIPFDWQLIKMLGEHNLVCPTIPEEYGGLGLDRFTTALVMEEIAAICPGLAAVIDTNVHAVEPLLLAGSKQQKRRISAATDRQGLLNWLLLHLPEPTGGSYINGMTTNADKDLGLCNQRTKRLCIKCPAGKFYPVVCLY
jgi:alkylation response protein AidB-like acyl-CoA dehydrogenase